MLVVVVSIVVAVVVAATRAERGGTARVSAAIVKVKLLGKIACFL